MPGPPRMCCLDLDTFFVSVERVRDPSLIGRPVVVGGRKGGTGVVTAASYEVREFGVHSGMSIRDATERAPHAIYLPGTPGLYGEYSGRARAITERFSPEVRAASIDESYIDFRGCELMYRRPGELDDDEVIRRAVCELTDTIRDELGIPASAGIATSTTMAKVASGLAKPAGVLLVKAGTEARTLAPLSVRKLPGIGPVAEAQLLDDGIERIGQLVDAPPAVLARIFGRRAGALRRRARGLGTTELGRERPAFREHDPEGERIGSISNERTFRETDRRVSETILSGLCERVCWRARRRGVMARTVTLKLRFTDFHTISRSASLSPTHSEETVFRVVHRLYRRARHTDRPIRLLGVALSNLGVHETQLGLFDGDHEPRCEAVDTLRRRFGYDAVHLGATLRPGRARPPRSA